VSAADILDLIAAALLAALTVLLLRALPRFGRRLPWLVALMAYCAARAVARTYDALGGSDQSAFWVVSDGFSVLALVLLVLGLERTVRALSTAEVDAQRREDEYAHALADYRALARHRLANPLTAVRGAVSTLRSRPELDRDLQLQLLELVDEQVGRLEHVVLEPEATEPEERPLRPRPNPASVAPAAPQTTSE
jgi:signal transduction histidine kinase